MLRSLKSLRRYRIAARDGEIGEIYDFFFDEELWTVRYLVVDNGRWLPGRKVLLSPHVIGQPVPDASNVPVDMTREQVESSPEIDTDKPVSRQREIELYQHYGWSPYWSGAGMGAVPMGPVAAPPLAAIPEPTGGTEEKQKGDPHLRSTQEVAGYHIQASDGSIGHVEDFVVDDVTWDLRYLVVDTRNWLPGRKVLISPQWIVAPISWAESTVNVILTREQVKESPVFDPAAPVNREYEARLYDYYGRPSYW